MPTLLEMPDVVMSRILEVSSFRDVQALRKTCRYLRNFIDDLKPDPKIEKLAFYLDKIDKPGLIPSEIVIRYGGWNDIWVQYRQNQQGCLVDTKEKREKLLENEDFQKIAVNDLRLILESQKSKIEYFQIQIGCRNESDWMSRRSFMEEIQMPFLENLKNFLRNRPRPLSVKEVEVGAISHQDVLQILPYLDPKSISKIHVSYSFYGHRRPIEPLEIDEIVELEQWKMAKYFQSDLFLIFDKFHRNYAHFESVVVRTEQITAEDLKQIRETFLKSPNLQYFRVWYQNLKDPQPFGAPYTDNDGYEQWYFRSSKNLMNPEKILKITRYDDYSGFVFVFEMEEYGKILEEKVKIVEV